MRPSLDAASNLNQPPTPEIRRFCEEPHTGPTRGLLSERPKRNPLSTQIDTACEIIKVSFIYFVSYIVC